MGTDPGRRDPPHPASTAPSLVILAAGRGSRYGGAKQLEPAGPAGERLLDYAIHHASSSGFGQVVLVVRPELEPVFRSAVLPAWRDRVPVRLVLQRNGPAADREPSYDAPAEHRATSAPRKAPWGTAHAVLAAREALTGPFAVVNADDFYGAAAYALLHAHLAPLAATDTRFAMVAFPLGHTLSPHGGVSRALCHADEQGRLRGMEELRDVRRRGGRIQGKDQRGTTRILASDAPVSMNMWGFTPAVFPMLAEGFDAFLDSRRGEAGEYLLPDAVAGLIAASRASVQVLGPATGWFGLTHPADLAYARRSLASLIVRGHLPARLFPGSG